MRFEPSSDAVAGQYMPLMLCFSHLRWNFVYQRPQHLLTRAARNKSVIFFEEPIFEEIAAPTLRSHRAKEGVTVVVPCLPRERQGKNNNGLQRVLLDDRLAELGAPVDLAWYYTPMSFAFSDHLVPAVTVYDNMDELSAFRGAPPEMIAMEKRLFQRADVVFTGGQSLYEAKRGCHANLHAFPSSIDATHFGRARSPSVKPLPDQDYLTGPRIGFFGVIDERLDLDLLHLAAQGRPDWQFIMIGPVVKIDPAGLPRLPNLHWLGPKDYRELPDYLSGWNVGMMPFALNESTRFISPTKTPEFLAAGLPVVSTAIEDVVRPYGRLELVEIADGAEDFVAKVEQLLARRRQPWLSMVDRHLATMSWDMTWKGMNSLIETARHPVADRKTRKEISYV